MNIIPQFAAAVLDAAKSVAGAYVEFFRTPGVAPVALLLAALVAYLAASALVPSRGSERDR